MAAVTDLALTPDLDGFRAAAAVDGCRVIAVYARLLADDFTPVGLYHQLCGDRTGTFLFESADNGQWSRYSFVGVNAAATLTEDAGQAVWRWSGRAIEGLPSGGDPVQVLRETMAALATPRVAGLPTMTSGMVGYLGYDIVRRLENLPDAPPDDLHLPELVMMLTTDLAVLDHHTGEVWLIANALNFDGSTARVDDAYADAAARVRAMADRLCEPARPLVAVAVPSASPAEIQRQRTPAEYEALVAAAVEEIRAGEAFQIVGSQRFELPCDADPLDVYRVLRRTNPSPYLYLLRLDGFAVVGSSPEALVSVDGDRAVTRPIAGTRPRGANPEADAALEVELLADPKERAEHLMLVDLGRNDLDRAGDADASPARSRWSSS